MDELHLFVSATQLVNVCTGLLLQTILVFRPAALLFSWNGVHVI